MIFRQALICSMLIAVTLAAPATKIEPKLTASLKTKNLVNIFVKFHGDTSGTIRRAQNLHSTGSRGDKITQIVTDLQSLSKSSQQNAVNFLRARSPFTSHKQIWISNELYVKGASSQLVLQLASLPEVKEIREELVLTREPLTFGDEAPKDVEWNLQIVEAEQAWNLFGGNNGSGVVVANIDSGVRGTHEALRDNQRSNYSWFDPYDHTETANDVEAHGTHTMGTLVGSKGIGVAPGAQWIACKGWDAFGDPEAWESTLKECGQWVLCPTLPNGQSPNCTLAPRVVSNSWGFQEITDFYNEVIEAWRAADIIPVFANGNYGPRCSTTITPAFHEGVISVGATTENDNIADFSAAGPTTDGVLKPEITAPGHLVRSAYANSDTAYAIFSGTSMATPHVAGAVALLLSRNPELTYDQVKEILTKYADTDTLADTGSTCGGIPSTEFPNNQYGHGRLNARRALASLISGKP